LTAAAVTQQGKIINRRKPAIGIIVVAGRPLRHSGIPYQGINVVMLWSAAVTKGYACPLWLTFKQAIELGGHVRKGEAGELVVYADRITRTETDAKGEETEREITFMKGYTVFNAGQCDDLPAHYYAKAEPTAFRLDLCPICSGFCR
jgi:antirestriction protein ArdC